MHNTFFINVYFPCSTAGSEEIVCSLLAEIGAIIHLYEGYNVILGGDFNTDLSRNSKRSISILKFNTDLGMTLVSDVVNPNCNYTYFHDSMDSL
jgi:hypothetical protein